MNQNLSFRTKSGGGFADAVIAKVRPLRQRASGLLVSELDVGTMHGRDRNTPCPCKSGRKWKRCHGRPS